MRRSPWSRILSAVFAVWLALVMGEAGFVHHRCPMHDSPVPAAAGGEMAGHAGHGGGDAPNGGHHACTCIGACNASSAVTLTRAAELPAPDVVLFAASAPERPRESAPTARADVSLPFANGPPVPAAIA